MLRSFFLVSLFALISAGCCPSSRILLLDVDKAANALVVKTDRGEQVLDQPNTYTELTSASARPGKIKTLAPEEIKRQYGQLLEMAPVPPKQILLYFEPGSTTLTSASAAQLDDVEAAIKERLPCDVNIIGHADRAGSEEYNIDLSLRRAKVLHDWLLSRQLEIVEIIVESYGEEDPLIPTEDGVAEPKNRRVEVLIR